MDAFKTKEGKVVVIGLLEFEQDVGAIEGVSGGPVVDREGNLVGLCEKGRFFDVMSFG